MHLLSQNKVFFCRWGVTSYDEIEEQSYHEAYMTAGEMLDAFVAIHDDKLVDISIGCPLIHGVTICADLIETGLNQGKPYYFGDIIVDKKYWGQEIANTLYQEHLNYVRAREYSHALALLVERANDDPRKPSQFKPSRLWAFHDFNPTDFTITYPWHTFTVSGEIKQETHTLRAYEKVLSPERIDI